ncbi:mercuric reductase [Nitzschia inconspicua]|uniref:Mercuric reductase n=1 Tax=Nitzschia inconspicua TaxID=303405 RepID=A0A9K3PBU6_9STRA|nr:mercuric reductase [Nitzschia inconspicua]
MGLLWIFLLITYALPKADGWSLSWFKNRIVKTTKPVPDDIDDVLEYDVIIVGAGASGMFASGTSTMLGSKTLLLDFGVKEDKNRLNGNIGGDCTNAACVPSKAVRSLARMAAIGAPSPIRNSTKSWLLSAREHATITVNKVRFRESPSAMVARNKNLDIGLLSDGNFVNSHEMDLDITEFFSSTKPIICVPRKIRARGKKFILATGASPVVPEKLQKEAEQAALHLYTYRTLLRPGLESNDAIWNHSSNTTNNTIVQKKIVVAGGGATACELTQSLARLSADQNVEIHLVAPVLLPKDDVTLQNAALQILSAQDNVHFHLGNRVEAVLPDIGIRLSDGSTIHDAEALLLCIGRRPQLESLQLENAGIAYDKNRGVLVHPSTLRSISSKHVYACGDCASAVNKKPNGRTATQAAWTGYHAASNAILPKLLTLGSKSVQNTVPRVVYTDPELASVGLSLSECIQQHGLGGFDRLTVGESGTDRSDMESLERPTAGMGFIEIRATKLDGRILGMCACGPSASELANEMSVVIQNRLTVRDVAKSLHSYPSHGYLMHRVALSLALNNIWGYLEACGPVGGLIARPGRMISKIIGLSRRRPDWTTRNKHASLASQSVIVREGEHNTTYLPRNHTILRIVSKLDLYMKEDVEGDTLPKAENL